jgi:hypothetical protein
MKKKLLIIIISLLTATLTLTATPVHAGISTYSWIAPFYRGYDEFYEANVVAYKTGSTAQLLVSVYNQYGLEINVTDVKVWFDWNRNYSSTETPCIMKSHENRNFIINFTVPDTANASNLILHRYIVYVEFLSELGPGSWSDSGQNFAIYSTDQADTCDLSNIYDAYSNNFPYYYFDSAEARSLAIQAVIEATSGEFYYKRGDFATAKTRYETAVDLYDQAITGEREWARYSQEVELNATKTEAEASLVEANAAQTQADAAMIMANASMNQSYAWFLFGIGFIIISVGVLVYAVKKPKTP